MREICFDTETTGLDPKDGHKVIEIACIELVDKVQSGRFYHVYINPRRAIPAAATNIHGITDEFIKDKPIFDHIAKDFLEFIGDAKLIAHNAPFDMKFLNSELRAVGLNIITNEIADSLQIARRKFPGSPNSLDALCKRFGIDLSKRTKHGALLDTELLCDVYVELMGGLQSGFGFNAAKDNEDATKASANKIDYAGRKTLPARDFTVSSEDEELHKKFILDNLKSNLWNY
jgi:DNA polymerase-3 subunit epsilon